EGYAQSTPAQPGSAPSVDRDFNNLTPTPSESVSQSTESTVGMNQAQTETRQQPAMVPGAPPPSPLVMMEPEVDFRGATVLKRERLQSDHVQSPYYKDEGRDQFAKIETNNIKDTKAEPVSTFSIDVDKASY